METARVHWAELDGYAVAHGLGYLQDLPIDRFANFVWYMLTKDHDSKEIDKLRGRLWQPPLGTVVTDTRSPWSAEKERGSLSALKRSLGG